MYKMSFLGYELAVPKSFKPSCLLGWECCNENWIKYDNRKFLADIEKHVFGQPFLSVAADALSAHFHPSFKPAKALTLSFHGMTGTGKNYVSKFIAESIYKNGAKSKYVHHFTGRMHFQEVSKSEEYTLDLYTWIKGNLTECPRQLFIFDEVDKMIPEVLNALKPIIDYGINMNRIDYSKAIFIFLSNTGAQVINELYHDLFIKYGKIREDLKLSDFEGLIQKGVFNEAGGFHHSDTIKNNLIDHYIPFLPLEEKHVTLCVVNEFMSRNIFTPKAEHIKEVMEFVEWGPNETKQFSKTGCKRIGQKVAVLAYKHYSHLMNSNIYDEL